MLLTRSCVTVGLAAWCLPLHEHMSISSSNCGGPESRDAWPRDCNYGVAQLRAMSSGLTSCAKSNAKQLEQLRWLPGSSSTEEHYQLDQPQQYMLGVCSVLEQYAVL